MPIDDLPRTNAALAQKLQARLDLRRAATLAEAVQAAGRRLPKPERKAARQLVEAEGYWGHPKLRRQLDGPALDAAAARLRRWIEAKERAERRRGMVIGILATLAFNFLVIAAAVIGWLWYTGWF
jgi:ATP-dependent exoDNAse (exonuclease V) alpha subunit